MTREAYPFVNPPSYAEACDAAPASAPRPLVVWTQHYADEAMATGADLADESNEGCWARLCRWRATRSGTGAAACTDPS